MHRLVVVDEQEVVRGIVSLSDILQALVLTDAEEGKYGRAAVQDLTYTGSISVVLKALQPFTYFP